MKGKFVVGLVVSAVQAEVIKNTVDGKRIREKQILSVINPVSLADLTQEDLIFVAATSPDKEEIIALVRDRKSFVEHGGHLTIVRQGNKTVLLVNLQQARKKGFGLSSNLLRLASFIIDDISGGVL